MDPVALLRLIESPEFLGGFLAGLVALAIGLIGRRLALDWGLLWLTAVLLALAWAGGVDQVDTERALTESGWIIPAAALSIALATYGLVSNRHRREIGPAFAGSVAGIWATVPDTEEVAVLMGVTAALVWLWWPRRILGVRTMGALAMAAGSIWVGSLGAIGREGASVGAFGAVASLALLGVPSRMTSSWWRFAFHALMVLGWTRLAGLSRSAPNALLLGVAVTLAVSAVKEAVVLLQARRSGQG